MNPTTRSIISFVCILAALLPVCAFAKEKPVPVAFPSGMRHDSWDVLLKKYVNERGLVAYEKWKATDADRKALDSYLAQFAARPATPATGNDLAASGINAYNASAIQWIIQNYPTDSIQTLRDSFSRKGHQIGGMQVALDDIEHGTMRPLLGYRAHAALVCCARSCPPLQRTAYTAAGIEGQIDAAYAAWLGREDLNQFHPAKNRVAISSIFTWFKEDFEAAGGVQKLLGARGPAAARPFLAKGGYKVENLPYHWGLNDQGKRGESYSRANLYFDALFK